MIFGVFPRSGEAFSLTDSLLVSGIAIAVVFIILIIIILVCSAFQKGIEVIECKTNIKPRPENKLLEEDEDAVVASLVATIDFYKETGKNARLVSIEKVED